QCYVLMTAMLILCGLIVLACIEALGAGDLGVMTPRALVYAGVMTSTRMLCHAHFDSDIISQTVGAQSSRVSTPLPDDPYVAVRHAHLVDTDTESEPKEAPSEIEEWQPLVSRVPLTDEEFEVSEPSDTRITLLHFSALSDSTAPLSPNHSLTQTSPTLTPTQVSFHRKTARMAVRTQPTLSPSMSARIMEAVALPSSSFRKRYRSSYETPSPSSSPTLPIRKRYQ
nr:hypothetical protein [Tanacetum cinerariifolium]